MKKNELKILDCTLRDGGYYNNWNFSIELINKYLKVMSDIKVDYVEIGFRSNDKKEFRGACAYTTDEFLNSLKNINQINCYSNEGNTWRNSKINFIDDKNIEILLVDKFIGERGRINCSLREKNGFWRWLGIQFVIAE